MVYKKYIRRNGKVYGPYIYHSKRVNGKVVSEYIGTSNEESSSSKGSKIIFIIMGFLVLLVAFSLVSYYRSSGDSHVVINLDSSYVSGESLKGALHLDLNEGELIPASSRIIFENNGETKEYNLSDLISLDKTEGDFYLKGSSIKGSGEGYGLIGTAEVHPDVFFKFKIYSKAETGSSGESSSEGSFNISSGEENSSNEEKEEVLEESNGVTQDTLGEGDVVTESSESTEGSPTDEGASTVSEEKITSPLTGEASLDFEKEVQGDVSYNKPFEYNLAEGETIEIVEDSVRTETADLGEDILNVEVSDNKVIITTNYSEQKKGFGEEYLGDKTQSMLINLGDLNLNFSEGDLKISVVYDGKELISVKTLLKNKENQSVSEEGKLDVPVENKTIQSSNLSVENKEIFKSAYENVSLTEQEISILKENFPDEKIIQTAKRYKSWIVVRFELGDYFLEQSYSSSLGEEELQKEIERDKTIWIKDIANQIMEKDSSFIEIPELSEEYNISNSS
ncbi:hypothetical protein B6U91_01160 [Candidatus Pacearchaeota archaeon ex4484_71]|nr:MAG: hypothetical protein B6U91_01160 [Candidatus Pacearchaeota archaeon ex4484_71]